LSITSDIRLFEEKMMRKLLLLAPLLLLGCTNERDAPDEATAAPIGPAVSCINLDQVAGRRPVAPRSIVFEVAGGVTYRNDMKDSCPSLERADTGYTLAFDVTGSRLCEDDNVRVFDAVQARAIPINSFPRCRLGKFTPIARR
jgi:hypothetical protein